MIIPANTINIPNPSRIPTCSLRINTPPITATIDSKLKISDAVWGGTFFCPTICKVYPTPLERTPTASNCQITLYISASIIFSVNTANSKLSTDTTINWTIDKNIELTLAAE